MATPSTSAHRTPRPGYFAARSRPEKKPGGARFSLTCRLLVRLRPELPPRTGTIAILDETAVRVVLEEDALGILLQLDHAQFFIVAHDEVQRFFARRRVLVL